MANSPLLAAVDLGTTGVRALITTAQGHVLGTGAREVPILPTAAGWSEQSPDIFWEAMIASVQEALRTAKVEGKQISALGFSQQRCTVGFAGKNGEALTNFIVWMDRRGVPYLDCIHSHIGLPDYYQAIGLPIYYISALTKILWFKDQAKEIYHAAERIWPIGNFMLARMGLKDPPLDHATASFYGLFDSSQRVWAEAIISGLGLDLAKMPPLVQPASIVGHLSDPEAARLLGLPPGLPLVIGGGDQQCSALGSGMIHMGNSLINLGTGTALMAAVDKPVRDPRNVIPCCCHAAPGRWEMEGHTQAAGVILQRFRDEFADGERALAARLDADVYDLLTQQASRSVPGAAGLAFLPMFNGSTAPVDEPYGAGALIGLRLSHSRSDILRAILEGICLENRWIIDGMIGSGADIRDIAISGGASKSPFWNQLHANILKRPVTQVSTSNAALVGAVICTGLATGVYASVEEGVAAFPSASTTYQPQPEAAQTYDRLYASFVRGYAELCRSGVFQELRAIGE